MHKKTHIPEHRKAEWFHSRYRRGISLPAGAITPAC